MPATPVDQRGQRAPAGQVAGDVEVGLSRLYRGLAGLGIAFTLIGAALGLARDRRLPTATVSLGRLPDGLLHLRADALLTLGILTFLSAPVLALAYVTVAFLVERNRLYALVALVVLGILAGSIALSRGVG
ncbi:MAG: DUF1634 domain-containing protein [Thermomicrobiaceae bacterium]|nr:DUF1634 domain-containing protein [Thermomicrobiaceae bacterium]